MRLLSVLFICLATGCSTGLKDKGTLDNHEEIGVVYFEPGSAELSSKEAKKLRKYKRSKLNLKFVGHAFQSPSHKDNVDLSKKMAEAVKKVVRKGEAVGVGGTFCASDCERVYNLNCKSCRKVVIYAY